MLAPRSVARKNRVMNVPRIGEGLYEAKGLVEGAVAVRSTLDALLGLPLPALLALALCAPPHLTAQQRANPDFDPSVPELTYAAGDGARVLFDEAHHNFHTADGRYAPFVRLLEADGFRIARNAEPFTAASLAGHDLLVISSARGAPPGEPGQAEAAFTAAEAEAVEAWVREGGGLLLITDHPPAATPPRPLAERFGIGLVDASPRDTLHFWESYSWLTFTRRHGTLGDHPITRGRGPAERVGRVVTFAGNSIVPPPGATVLLGLPPTALENHARPPRGDTAITAIVPAAGSAQGIALVHGRGRVVALAEAAAWTSQVFGEGPEVTGMDEPGFHNRRFLLNAVRWLAGALPEAAPALPAPDPGFEPAVDRPTHTGRKPVVLVDAAHHNPFTAGGRFGPLAALLSADGYRPADHAGPLDRAALEAADVLVIAGPRGADPDCETPLLSLGREDCAAARPAFAPSEVAAVEAWVREGGALLLALDAFPSALAGAELARAFGVEVAGGLVLDWVHREGPGVAWITFEADSGTVARHPATRGVGRVVLFGTTSLAVEDGGPAEAATALLTFAPPAIERLPGRVRGDTAFVRVLSSVAGRAAALALPWGRGRVVVLGDAELLTSQRVEGAEEPVGLDGPPGHDNRRFVRGVFRWLSGGGGGRSFRGSRAGLVDAVRRRAEISLHARKPRPPGSWTFDVEGASRRRSVRASYASFQTAESPRRRSSRRSGMVHVCSSRDGFKHSA